jgi:hypothetical protein
MEESQHIPKKTIVQKIKRSELSLYSYAFRYYSILSAINDLKLTEREIQLISFAAIKGNISYSNIRKEFCEMYNSSAPTINNIISKLRKKGILIKDGTKVKVHPIISLDFSKDIVLEIKLLQNG